ncbi:MULTISPECIES: hypothetical protein [unclassified Microcoleus]
MDEISCRVSRPPCILNHKNRRVRRHQKSQKRAKISQRRTLQELGIRCVAIKNPKKERKSRSDAPYDN